MEAAESDPKSPPLLRPELFKFISSLLWEKFGRSCSGASFIIFMFKAKTTFAGMHFDKDGRLDATH